MNFLQNTYFKDINNIEVEKNLRLTINFYKKQCLPFITWNKNQLLQKIENCANDI